MWLLSPEFSVSQSKPGFDQDQAASLVLAWSGSTEDVQRRGVEQPFGTHDVNLQRSEYWVANGIA